MSHAALEGSLGTSLSPLTLRSEAVPSLGPQLLVAMESGYHPSSPLLGRRLAARHHLLGHLSFQRACFRLSGGGSGPLGAQRLCFCWNLGGLFSRAKGSEGKKREAGVWDTPASSCSVSACSSLDSRRQLGRAYICFTDGDKWLWRGGKTPCPGLPLPCPSTED